MSDSGYTPSMEEMRQAWQKAHMQPDGSHQEQFDRFVAVIRADERKLQAERDAQLVIEQGETLSNTGLNVRNALWGVARVIRGQSFTGTEEQK